jgi:hypothetical protein
MRSQSKWSSTNSRPFSPRRNEQASHRILDDIDDAANVRRYDRAPVGERLDKRYPEPFCIVGVIENGRMDVQVAGLVQPRKAFGAYEP